MNIPTSGPDGPWCPICLVPVKKEGEFCSINCWEHFHIVVAEAGQLIGMKYLDMEEQPWYGGTHGFDT